jgi:hypothetical protein
MRHAKELVAEFELGKCEKAGFATVAGGFEIYLAILVYGRLVASIIAYSTTCAISFLFGGE